MLLNVIKVLLGSTLAICVNERFNLRLDTLFEVCLKSQQCIAAISKTLQGYSGFTVYLDG